MGKIKVGIVGGTGYTGVELMRLLSQHDAVQIEIITSRQEAGRPVSDLYPSLRGTLDICYSEPDADALAACDLVFFATPHGVAMAQARELLAANTRIIDLAADFRLQDLAQFERWYKMPHACPDILKKAVYGLPELNRAAIADAQVVGMPGCYPTTVQLGLMPVLQASGRALIETQGIIADCKSGVSGAGRQAKVGNLLAEASDNFKAYALQGHRHWPEIEQGLAVMAGGPVSLTFVPHLVPMIRGIHSTLYARIRPEALDTDFQALYEDHYRDEPFVDVMPAGSTPETRSVRGSNVCRIAVHRPPESDLLVVLVVEDNLVKGASGQAVQVMNVMFGLAEKSGLNIVPLMP